MLSKPNPTLQYNYGTDFQIQRNQVDYDIDFPRLGTPCPQISEKSKVDTNVSQERTTSLRTSCPHTENLNRPNLVHNCNFIQSKHITVPVIFQTHQVSAILDTGSELSILNSNLLNDQSLQKTQLQLNSCSGERLNLQGILDTTIEIDNRSFDIQFYCVAGLSQPMILGLDFLQSVASGINLNNNALIYKFPINQSTSSSKNYPVPVSDNVIMERSEPNPINKN